MAVAVVTINLNGTCHYEEIHSADSSAQVVLAEDDSEVTSTSSEPVSNERDVIPQATSPEEVHHDHVKRDACELPHRHLCGTLT